MRLYVGLDLHSTNVVISIVDETGRVVFERRERNDLGRILETLAPDRDSIATVAVESTYNWYWLVDGLRSEGYDVRLAHVNAMKQYEGLKYRDDWSDAQWLGELLRLEILPEGWVMERETRSRRDLLRRRSQLVRHRTSHLLSILNQFSREHGRRPSSSWVRSSLTEAVVEESFTGESVIASVCANLRTYRFFDEEIGRIESLVKRHSRANPDYRRLRTLPGVGEALAWTILYESGPMDRYAKVGNYASYARCVPSVLKSNKKVKGRGNTKSGNRYLAWAFVEAANHAVRHYAPITRFYQRKRGQSGHTLAVKAVAHKLARATYYVLRDGVTFEMEKAFGGTTRQVRGGGESGPGLCQSYSGVTEHRRADGHRHLM